MQYFGIRVLIKRIAAIRFMMKDKSVPKWKKAIIVAGILYVLLPFDVIPIAVLPVSWLDDVILWGFILWYLRYELDKYWFGEKKVDLSEKYRRKTMVDDVEYEVRKDKSDDDE